MLFKFKKDYTYHILGIFSILIFSAFFLTFYISQTNKNNYSYLNNLKKLELLNKDIDILLFQKLKYINSEKIGSIRYKIESNLQNIEKYLKFLNDKKLSIKFENLQQKFREKSHMLSWFQFHNERIIKNIENLIKLQEILQRRYYFSEIYFLINNSLVNLLHLAQNKQKMIQTNIVKLDNLYKDFKLNDPELNKFILNLREATANFEQISYINHKAEQLNLSKVIKNFEESLIQYYTKSQNNQRIISYLLIFLSLLFLFIIVLAHRANKHINISLLKFRNAVEESFNSVVITDIDSNITYVNSTFEKTTGYSASEVIGENPRILKAGLMDKEFYAQIYQKLTKGEKWIGMFINKKKNGEIFYEQASISPIFYQGKIDGYLAIKLDITNLIEQTNKLKTAQQLTHIGSIEIDWETNTVKLSEELGKILKISNKTQITYNEFLSFISKKDREIFDKKLKNSIKLNEKFFIEHKITDSQKNIKYVISRFEHKYKHKNTITSISTSIGTIQDITEITVSRERVKYMAYHDLLTNFLNKEGFLEEIKTAIEISSINNSKLSLLSLDIDKFKDINETLGHEIGDELLKIVGKRLKNTLTKEAIIARFGGDEFFILLKNSYQIDTICNKLLYALSQPMKIKNYTINITASIGVAFYPQDGTNALDILKNSDAAMYFAKEEGRNRYRFYTKEISNKIDERIMIENALKKAIKNQEFTILYQPQISIRNKQIIAAEALIRWNSKELGPISPSKFIPIAEDSGQIIEIGEWVFKNACKEFLRLQQKGYELKYIAINISSIQLEQKGIVDKLKSIIDEIGIDASFIELEITERFLVMDNMDSRQILKRLKDLGFKISIDDFGTGYSSLNYLRKFPIDTLKIDKSFIDNIKFSKEDRSIVEAIISLSKNLNHQIVAEGVEDMKQETILANFGNILCQGYLYAKPLNPQDFMRKYDALRNR